MALLAGTRRISADLPRIGPEIEEGLAANCKIVPGHRSLSRLRHTGGKENSDQRHSVKGFPQKLTQKEGEANMTTTITKENNMKATSSMSKVALFAAILACLIFVASGSASAQAPFRNDTQQTIKLICGAPGGVDCPDWGESVSISEPATALPVVVTWSARYFINTPDEYYVGLDVNGTGCQTGLYGPLNLDDIATNPAGHFLTVTFQWVVEVSDGVLIAGKENKFELCGGGGDNVVNDEITLGQNTLSVAKD
jgi:hypothetical protein